MFEKINKEIANIDRLLSDLDSILDSAQPTAAGKIRIFFWKTNGDGIPRPVITRLSQDKSQKYKERLDEKNLIRRASTKGQFYANHKQVKDALAIITDLITYRKKLEALYADIEKRTRLTISSNHSKISNSTRRIPEIQRRVNAVLEKDDKSIYARPINSGELILDDASDNDDWADIAAQQAINVE